MLRKGPTSLLEVGPFVYSLKILSVITDKIQTVDKSPISSERDWTFSMYKMKINVEISMIKAINMI